MTAQQIVALGQMWPNGDASAIQAAIEYIGEQHPDRVIATAGATESFLRDLRGSYDGWVGAHLAGASLCEKYEVEPLGDCYEFTPGWVTYSGPLNHSGHPDLRPLNTARKLKKSIVTGATHRASSCSYALGLGPVPELQVTGIGVGHLCSSKQWLDGHVSACVLSVCEDEVERRILSYRRGVFV